MAHVVFAMQLLTLLTATTVFTSELNVVDESGLVAVDVTESRTDTGDRKLIRTTTTKAATEGQRRTGVTLQDEARPEQSWTDQLSEVDEGRHLMERFYQRYNTTAEVDLVFVLDRSGSVPPKGWQSMIEFVKVSTWVYLWESAGDAP